MQKSILCYGDSNTWGYIPNDAAAKATRRIGRYARHERWPGLLQAELGDGYHIIEEGLNGRTTNIDYIVPPDRNGKNYLAPCLYTHAPIDLVILALGANDMKTYFNREASDIRDGLAELISIIQGSKYGPAMQIAPNILILSQSIPAMFSEEFVDDNGVAYFKGGVKKSELLVDFYSELAKNTGCHFLNISDYIRPSIVDGFHYDLSAHRKISAMLVEKISSIF